MDGTVLVSIVGLCILGVVLGVLGVVAIHKGGRVKLDSSKGHKIEIDANRRRR